MAARVGQDKKGDGSSEYLRPRRWRIDFLRPSFTRFDERITSIMLKGRATISRGSFAAAHTPVSFEATNEPDVETTPSTLLLNPFIRLIVSSARHRSDPARMTPTNMPTVPIQAWAGFAELPV